MQFDFSSRFLLDHHNVLPIMGGFEIVYVAPGQPEQIPDPQGRVHGHSDQRIVAIVLFV